MIGVVIIPTGIGAEIGGHAGDGTPVARLFGALCDTVITHPNVVNGSDLNEMPHNTLYVEGSALDRFLKGELNLVPVKRPNRILVAVNPSLRAETINAVSAARVTLGINASIMVLDTPLYMKGWIENNMADGMFSGAEELVDQVRGEGDNFDVLAVTSPIHVQRSEAMNYLKNGGANPWGKVEALLSAYLSKELFKPVAHSPMESDTLNGYGEVTDPRMSAELLSMCFLHCILKGLHMAPKLFSHRAGITAHDVDFMVTPWGCWGPAHRACREKGIPIIGVRENRTIYKEKWDYDFVAENYWEAAGIVASWLGGISPESVRRPMAPTSFPSDISPVITKYVKRSK